MRPSACLGDASLTVTIICKPGLIGLSASVDIQRCFCPPPPVSQLILAISSVLLAIHYKINVHPPPACFKTKTQLKKALLPPPVTFHYGEIIIGCLRRIARLPYFHTFTDGQTDRDPSIF